MDVLNNREENTINTTLKISNAFIEYIHNEITYYRQCFRTKPTMVIVNPVVKEAFMNALRCTSEDDFITTVLGMDLFVSPKVKYAEVF